MQLYVAYSDRPAWSDVEPVLQDDGENPPVPIKYTEKFADAMNYFRAVLRSEEKSQRVLDLTTDVIALNPANYTAWHYRVLVCDAIGADWDAQYRWVTEMGPNNPKNYQIWNFRKQCVKRTNQPQRELDFIREMLDDDEAGDAKNYHAWAPEIGETLALREVSFAMERLTRSPENDAAWSYALSWCRQLPKGCEAKASDGAMEAARSAVLEACEAIEHSTRQEILGCLAAMGEVLEEEGLAAAIQGDDELRNAAFLAAAEKFAQLSELDAIRAGYWSARRHQTELRASS